MLTENEKRLLEKRVMEKVFPNGAEQTHSYLTASFVTKIIAEALSEYEDLRTETT